MNHPQPTRRRRLTRAAVVPAVIAAAALCAPGAVSAAEAAATQIYVAPDGDDTAAGDSQHPFATIARAQEAAAPGDTVTLRGGTSRFDDATTDCTSRTDQVAAVALTKSGADGSPIRYVAADGETPVLDFSGVTDDCRIKGVSLVADHVLLRGLEITGVPQNNDLNNESWGVWVDGSYNTLDRLDVHHVMGAGVFIQDGGSNVVRNTDSHDNYDPHSKSGAGQNADGFGSHTNTRSSLVNLFQGNRAWNNADDGFDFISSSSPVWVRNSWAWHNGYVYGTDETAASGNGTGFKLGGYGGVYDPNPVDISVTNSVAFDNTLRGFYANHHPIAPNVLQNTAFDNGVNYDMRGIAPDGSAISVGTLRNNVAYGKGGLANLEGTNSRSNSWQLGLKLTAGDFRSVSHDGWDAPRAADGSLPVLPNMRPSSGSALVDAGSDIGYDFSGAAPDLGAFES